ncbi:MAG: cysteine desulfurase [Erysipelothrix sp.]|nr:cysteine desulfurase [Erysipelothrix sp.]
MSFKKEYYLDNASTTSIHPEILKTYVYLLEKYYANNSAIHRLGREVNDLHEKARHEILKLLQLKHSKLIFTAGASEANNMAIKAVAMANADRGKHLITTNIEHPSVHNSFRTLEENMGFTVTYLDVESDGTLDLNKLKQALRPDTVLVSIMNVNNEVGTIIPTAEWTRIVKENSRAFTHSDMVQALGTIPLDMNNVDIASFSAHKINGVKGSGFMVIREHIKMKNIIDGGDQEYGLRPGTENAPANIVLAKTVRLALENQKEKAKKLSDLSSYFYSLLADESEILFNSTQTHSVPGIVNFSIIGVNSEIILNAMGAKGIYVSAGSTCQSDIHMHSRVLASMKKSIAVQKSRVRLSLNTQLEKSDIDVIVSIIKEIKENYAL